MPVKPGQFIESLLRLTRAWNLLIIILAQYFTAIFLIDEATADDLKLFLLALSTGMIAAAGYIINDYYDVKIDFINKPDRVVVGRSISRRYAILLHTLLSLSGIAIGFLLSWWIVLTHFLSAFFLWLYSNSLKRLPFIGNFVVALLTGLSIAVVALLYQSHNILVIIYAVFAFFMTLIREIIKDMEDLRGDNTFGCKTLPIVWGLRRTKVVIYITLALFSLSVIVINEVYVKLPLWYFVFFLLVPLLFFTYRLYRADTRKDFSWLSTFCKLIMLLGIVSMMLV